MNVAGGSSGHSGQAVEATGRQARKDAARNDILKHASRRFRGDGLAASGVRALMADAGLTHGTFYSHFGSRSALIAAAVGAAAVETCESLKRASENAPSGTGFDALVDAYLSPLHVDHMDLGCAAAALAPEIAREGDESRRSFRSGVDLLVALMAKLLPEGGTADERLDRSYAIFGGMIGCLQLARVYAGEARADCILKEGRRSALKLARSPWNGGL